MNEPFPSFFVLNPNRVWRSYEGGKILDQLEKKPKPVDSHFPEDWIASTTRAINPGREDLDTEGLSNIQFQEHDVHLIDLIKKYPKQILGNNHVRKFGLTTQFLLKFLDSSIRLHIQCHPTIEFSKTHFNSDFGKTEAYYILATRPEVVEPYFYMGFQHPPTPEAFKMAIKKQNIGEITGYFEKIPVRPGDCFIVPGGLPHAIGEGILMIEILEPSDFCVRVEFKRGDYELPRSARFMDRGIDFALTMFNYSKISAEDIKNRYFLKPRDPKYINSGATEEILIDQTQTTCFRLKKITIEKTVEKREDSFYIAIVTKGKGTVSDEQHRIKLKFGDKIFVPFQTESLRYETEDGLEIVIALPPE